MKHVYFFTNRVVKSFRGLALAAFVLLGVTNAWGETYTLVTSAPADWSGDYLIVSGTSALSGGTSSWGTFETVTVSGNDITTTSNIAVTISPGGTSGSYYIYQNSNSTYLAEVSSNTFTAVATASTSTEWVISLNSGNAQIGCHSASTRLLRLNGVSGFRCYTTATGTLPKLYKKQVASSAYTVTFNAGTGSCGTASLTEASVGAGVTLPPASPSDGCAAETPAWEFAGWATASQAETTSAPTLYPSGSKYYPSDDVMLHAVYKQTTGSGNATDLFISQYIEGSSNNKYIEIFNGTGSPVNLSNYKLQMYANGSTSTSNDVTLSGTLANNATIVYQNSSAALTLPNGITGVNNAAVGFNGDDAIALYKISTSSYVDVFGRIGEDPGTAWTSGSYTTLDKTLVRKSSVSGGIVTNPTSGFPTLATEWETYNTDVVTYLGSHTFSGAATYTTNPLCCPNKLATPANFAATAGDTQVGLSWDAVSNATSYDIECVTHAAKSVTGITGTSTTITGLTNCTAYSFKITAVGDGVDYCPSPESGAISSTPRSAVLTATFNAGSNGTSVSSLNNTCSSNDITLPSATPNVGFAFDGWQVDGAGTVYAGGTTFTLSQDTSFVAKYHVLATYAISFMNEGIAVDSLQQIVSEGSAAAVESRTMLSTCSDYLFAGWTTTPLNGTVTTAPTYYDFATAVSGSVTLYAVYAVVDASGSSNTYDLVTDKASLTAGSKVIIASQLTSSPYTQYVMGIQKDNNRSGLAAGAANWTKSGNTITVPTGSTAAIVTIGKEGTNYTFSVSTGYLYAASSSANQLKTELTLNDNGQWALGAIDGTGKCASVVAQGTSTRNTMALNTNLFSCYSAQGSYGYIYFYKNTATASYTTNPVCSAVVVVDPSDVSSGIDSSDLVVGLGGTATSTGHLVYAKNCTESSFLQPVIYGDDKSVFSVDFIRAFLTNGAREVTYAVSYKPLSGTSHQAYLYFETNDHTVISDTIPLYGTVCEAVVFGSQSATANTVTINWTAPSAGSTLRVWNTITSANACASAPQPFDQTYTLGTELTRTITGLSASTSYYYQATSGTCISEQRTITTSAASGVSLLTAASTTLEFTTEVGKPVVQTVALSGVNMSNATVSVAITGAGSAAFSTNASVVLDASGKGTLSVTYTPTSSQTYVAVATLSYTNDCETKTVVVNLVGNVPGIEVVSIVPDASGLLIHTDFAGTIDLAVSQEVSHASGSSKVANDLFFSKYYEAYVSVKLVGIYNGTKNSIDLDSVRIVQKKGTSSDKTWSSAAANEIIPLDVLGSIAPGKEIILYSSGATTNDKAIMSCVKDGIGFDHEGWYPVGSQSATQSGVTSLFPSKIISFAGDKAIALQRQRPDGSWVFIDLIGAGDSVTVNATACVEVSTNDLNDDKGWYCAAGTNYKTKETVPLSTNRHLLIRKNTVVDGFTAVAQNTADFVTLCGEWEGLNVPTKPDSLQSEITCDNFSSVAEFNYNGYYASFEPITEGLVTFAEVGATAPGDWVGTFANPTVTLQDTLRCYNMQISVVRYYNRLADPDVELTKDEVLTLRTAAAGGDTSAQAILAALDTVQMASTQWRVPIIVKSGESIDTKNARFTSLSTDTCKTCDVVILRGGTLTKSAQSEDRDSVRSVIVYPEGRLIVPDGLNYVVNDLQIRAYGDTVGAAFVEGSLLMNNPRVVHDKRVDNSKAYFFTLPYDCALSKVIQMNGQTMGPYGITWLVKTYDGAQRIQNRGLSSNWTTIAAGSTLRAGVGYVLYISSDVPKYVRFPMVGDASFTEKSNSKATNVTEYGHAQAYGTNGTNGTLGWNNVGWNLVGNPYVSYFLAKNGGDSILYGKALLKGKYLHNSGGTNADTWIMEETDKLYVTIPDATADGGYVQKQVETTQLNPFSAFFIQADRTGTLRFSTSSRESVRALSPSQVTSNQLVLHFDVAGKSDQTTLILQDDYSLNYEIGKDLLKWKGKWGKTPYLYTFDSDHNPLAFNAMNYSEASGIIPVAFYMPTSYARYTFSLDHATSSFDDIEHVYLLRNGSIVADLLTTTYTGTDLKLKSENVEFALSIQRTAGVVTPVNPAVGDELMPYLITDRHEVRLEQLPTQGTVVVMDAIGRTVATRRLDGATSTTFNMNEDGVYIITVYTPTHNYTLKTVIR